MPDVIRGFIEDGVVKKYDYNYLANTPFVTPEMFGAKGDGETDDTAAIQSALDASAKHVVFDGTKTYLVSKQTDATIYPNGDDPCLHIINKDGFVIDGNGATLKVSAHGQGIMEILGCENVSVNGLKFEGHGTFPPISPDGRAEKGSPDGGYYKSGYDWESHKNNSVDTSAYTGVGGNPATVWGTFGGGYIGNAGIGLLIENGCKNINVSECSSEGFNYSGFSVGFRGHENYQPSRHIIFDKCYVGNTYDNGINLLLVDGVTVSNCFIENIGHPDARPADETDPLGYTYPDPGYGICCRKPNYSTSRARDVKVLNNTIEKCVRKGIDSHSADEFIVKNNKIKLCYEGGIELAGGSTEPTLTYNVIIDSNILEYCGVNGDAIKQTMYTGDASFDPNDYEANVTISNNILKNCATGSTYGIIYVRIGKNANVINNVISGVWPLATQTSAGIYVGQGERIVESVRVSGNNISIPSGHVYYPILMQNVHNGIVSNNIANVASCNVVLYVFGALANNVDIVGNNLYAASYVAAPAIFTTTGTISGNTFSGSARGWKVINDSYTFSSGSVAISDSFMTAKSKIFVTKRYSSSQPLNVIFTIQPKDAGVNIYARDGSGEQVNGNLELSILVINDYDS